ncbi:transmembrane protein 14 homolog [Sitodiplosis mosellana]|uniref:transmembrane protein 14 homolog n=1 Tax=Sitodiplosis mosellana TaxID=263140 RepID=UPI0024441C31|nr:transmembrane protein 14 homolog [Sitodiplosis mosellana]
MAIDAISYIYAATVAAGGIIGYVKAGSIPSLGAGLAFGAILGYGAHLNSQSPPKPLFQLGASLTLAGLMYLRWSKSGKLMPAGVICLLSAASFVRNVVVYNQQLPLPGRSQW